MNKSPISQVDVTTFLREMRRTPSGTLVTSKMLASKIQSSSEAQAIQAFDVINSRINYGKTNICKELIYILDLYRSLNSVSPQRRRVRSNLGQK